MQNFNLKSVRAAHDVERTWTIHVPAKVSHSVSIRQNKGENIMCMNDVAASQQLIVKALRSNENEISRFPEMDLRREISKKWDVLIFLTFTLKNINFMAKIG